MDFKMDRDKDLLPDIDQYAEGPILQPYNENMVVNYLALIEYAKEHQIDLDQLTEEEKDLFITYKNGKEED